MAISSVTIVQDNITSGKALLSAHNPLVFLVEAAYTVSTPEYLKVDLKNSAGTVLNTYIALPYSDTGSILTCRFVADDIFRAYMELFDDTQPNSVGISLDSKSSKLFTLKFYDKNNAATNDTVDLCIAHAVRQIGENPCLTSIYNNDAEIFYGYANKPVYVYFFNPTATGDLDIIVNGNTYSLSNQIVGFYRLFINNLAVGSYSVQFKVDNVLVSRKTLVIKEFETNGVLMKFLDKNGQYRFVAANRYYAINDNPATIGTTNEFITSILTNSTNRKVIGKTNERTWLLTVDYVETSELAYIVDIYTSPRVYLYINNIWVEVELTALNPIVKERKANHSKLQFSAKLPDWYTIKM